MIPLKSEDRKQLITVLTGIPDLANERGRQEILKLAGLEKIAPHIDISGNTFIAVSEIVSYLSDYGTFLKYPQGNDWDTTRVSRALLNYAKISLELALSIRQTRLLKTEIPYIDIQALFMV